MNACAASKKVAVALGCAAAGAVLVSLGVIVLVNDALRKLERVEQ